MSSLKMIFLLLVFLLAGLWETEAVSVTGVLRKEVTIECSHSNAFSNVKYFCKGECGYEDILISSRNNKIDSNGRYSIKDEGNTFSVTVSDLTKEDAGTYWCGIERYGVDTYNEVVLTVTEEKDIPSSHINALSSENVVYIVAGLGVAVLALAMVLLIFFRHRNRHINASSSGKDHDTVYAAPSSQKPDGLFYSDVSFNKHTDCSSVAPRTPPLTYSTIKHKAAEESVVYDNV